jgi:hypothetical protein
MGWGLKMSVDPGHMLASLSRISFWQVLLWPENSLDLPMREVASQIRNIWAKAHQNSYFPPSIDITPAKSLLNAIMVSKLLILRKSHRVWQVNWRNQSKRSLRLINFEKGLNSNINYKHEQKINLFGTILYSLDQYGLKCSASWSW